MKTKVILEFYMQKRIFRVTRFNCCHYIFLPEYRYVNMKPEFFYRKYTFIAMNENENDKKYFIRSIVHR